MPTLVACETQEVSYCSVVPISSVGIKLLWCLSSHRFSGQEVLGEVLKPICILIDL